MDLKFDINRINLSNAFIARDKEIFADSKDREKKKRNTRVIKKKPTKINCKLMFEEFHSVDFIG